MKNIPAVVFVLAAAAFLLFFELGRMDVWSDNEGQRAMPPVEMMARGDFITPTLNGEPYIVKPPLLYWLIVGVYKATGVVSPLTARIPTALCALGLVMGLFYWTRRPLGMQSAAWIAIGLIGSYYFLERARWAMLDVPLALGVFGAIVLWRRSRASNGAAAAGYIAAAIFSFTAALMFKGPPAFIFLWAAWIADAHFPVRGAAHPPQRWLFIVSAAAIAFEGILYVMQTSISFPLALAVAIVAWSISAIQNNARYASLGIGSLAIILIGGCALAAPWAIALVQSLGWDTIQAMIDEQVVERTYTASEINSGSPLFYFLLLPVLCAPFGLLFPLQAVPSFWKNTPDVVRFAGLLGWVSVLAFSLIAGKESEYVLPAFAFLLVPTGWHIAQIVEAEKAETLIGRIPRYWIGLIGALSMISAIGLTVIAWWNSWTLAVIESATILAIVVILFGVGLRKSSPQRLFYVIAAYVLVLGAGYAVRGADYTGEKSSKALGEAAGALLDQGVTVEVHRLYPAITFYAGQPVPVEPNPRTAREQMEEAAPYAYIIHRDDYERFIDRIEKEPAFISPPFTSKDLRLISNIPIPDDVAKTLSEKRR